MRFVPAFVAIGVLASLIFSCSHRGSSPVDQSGAARSDNGRQLTGIGPSGPAGPVDFGSGSGGLSTQTGTGLEGSTQYTPFGGTVGGFPTGEGIPLGGGKSQEQPEDAGPSDH